MKIMFKLAVKDCTMAIKYYVSFISLFISCCVCQAAPLKNIPVRLVQPDKDTLCCFVSGDEYYSYFHDKEGYTIIQDAKTGYYVYAISEGETLLPTSHIAGRCDPATCGLVPNANISISLRMERRHAWDVPESQMHPQDTTNHNANMGDLNNIVIFIRFSDDAEMTTSFESVNTMFNGSNSVSMRNYFEAASYNQLHINTTFYPIPQGNNIVSFQDVYPRSYYVPYNAVTNPNGYSNDSQRRVREFDLLERAVNYVNANNLIPTTLDIDYNSDGSVDNICFVVKGTYTGWSDLLWPHQWSLYDRYVYINGKRVYTYNFQLEGSGASYFSVGTLCHEMFHTLGAPDLYHYNNYTTVHPVGNWDLMDVNGRDVPQHSGAYMKWKYGKWITSLPRIYTNGSYTLHSVGSSPNNNCFAIPSNDPNQWYIVEYRNPNDPYESYVPGKGLLIYRVNSTRNGNADFNATTIFDEVYLFRPGASNETEAGSAYAQAYYSQVVGRTSFSPSMNPHPFLEGGVIDTTFSITDVVVEDSVVHFTYTYLGEHQPVFDVVVPTGQTLRCRVIGEEEPYSVRIAGMVVSSSSDSLVIPESVTNGDVSYLVTELAENAFSGNSHFSTVVLPNSLEVISQNAFANCELNSINIPQNVTQIAVRAFPDCVIDTLNFNAPNASSMLRHTYFPNVKVLKVGDGVRYIPSQAFYSDTNLTSVVLGEGVESIYSKAFYKCNKLSQLSLPNSLDSICNDAFYYDTCLRNLSIGENISFLGNSIFARCSFDTLSFNAVNLDHCLKASFFGDMECLIVGPNVDSIDNYAFSSSRKLKEIIFNEGLRVIGNGAFSGCSSLEKMEFPISLEIIMDRAFLSDSLLHNLCIGDNITYLGNSAFGNCKFDTVFFNASNMDHLITYSNLGKMSTLVLGDNVRDIPRSAFYGNVFLNNVSMSDNIKSIGSYAFYGCRNLVEVSFPQSLDSIMYGAFYNCTALSGTLFFPDSLRFIGGSSFENCTEVNVVSIGENMGKIESYAFPSSLDTVVCRSMTPPDVVLSSFGGVIPSVLLVPCRSNEGYQNHSIWNRFSTIGNYEDCSANLELFANLDEAGTLVGAGRFALDSTVTIGANPNIGYRFLYWNDSVQDNPRTVTLTKDTSFTAIFIAYSIDTLWLHDTTYVDQYIHDTTYVDRFVHDTTYIDQYIHDTTYVDRFVHDTTYVDRFIYDTTYIDQYIHDTTYVDRFIHDTTYVDQYIHDTTYVDRFVYDTTYIDQYIHDTVILDTMSYCTISVYSANLMQGIGAGNGRFTKGSSVEIAAIPIEGYRFLSWNDGNIENPRTVILTSDSYYIASFVSNTQSIDMQGNTSYIVTTNHQTITVQGAINSQIRVFDALGRCLISERNTDAIKTYPVPSSGSYLIQIDDRPAKKVVVVK